MQENAEHSTNLLFDRDLADGMPDALRDLDDDAFDAAVDLLFPGFAECGKVRVPSHLGAPGRRRPAGDFAGRPHHRAGRRPRP